MFLVVLIWSEGHKIVGGDPGTIIGTTVVYSLCIPEIIQYIISDRCNEWKNT